MDSYNPVENPLMAWILLCILLGASAGGLTGAFIVGIVGIVAYLVVAAACLWKLDKDGFDG